MFLPFRLRALGRYSVNVRLHRLTLLHANLRMPTRVNETRVEFHGRCKWVTWPGRDRRGAAPDLGPGRVRQDALVPGPDRPGPFPEPARWPAPPPARARAGRTADAARSAGNSARPCPGPLRRLRFSAIC